MEVNLQVIPMIEPEVPASDVETLHKFMAEPRRTSRVGQTPQLFENEISIFENDEPANYKEANGGL